MKPVDLLGLGSLAWDDLLTIDNFPHPDQKVRAQTRTKRIGGLTGGALLAATQCGGSAAYAGRLGTDAASQAVESALVESGVDVSLSVRAPENGVVQSVIIAATLAGTRNVFSFRNGETGAHPELPPLNACDHCNVLLVDHHGVPGQLRMAQHFRKTGRPVVCDIERLDTPSIWELLQSCSHILLPEAFALQLAETASPEEALYYLRSKHPAADLCLITQGEKGGLFCQKTDSLDACHQFVTPNPIKDCDTTGCGDFFHGAFCVALSRKQPAGACIEFAATQTAAFLTQRNLARF
jgi:sugar/nucleoside kinase (ribokinase family)